MPDDRDDDPRIRDGEGPPVLLLHGIPETHLMWHQVAPQLASRYTVVTQRELFGGADKDLLLGPGSGRSWRLPSPCRSG